MTIWENGYQDTVTKTCLNCDPGANWSSVVTQLVWATHVEGSVGGTAHMNWNKPVYLPKMVSPGHKESKRKIYRKVNIIKTIAKYYINIKM